MEQASTQSAIETISVWSVHDTRPLAQAWQEWSGFAMLLPDEVSRKPPSFTPSTDMPHIDWFRLTWDETKNVHPLGVHFLRDVTITGQGYTFVDNKLIQQDSYLHGVALQDVTADPRFSPAGFSNLEPIEIPHPVLDLSGPGSGVYGHWLMDFLPRAAVARDLLEDAFHELVIPLPHDIPDWVVSMLQRFVCVRPDRILRYNRDTQRLICSRVASPTFAHSGGGYFFHSYMRDFYARFVPKNAQTRTSRLCLSRKNFEQSTRGVLKGFKERVYMESAAIARGFEIVYPEELNFDQQIEVFAGAAIIIGEYGSALHNSIFSAPRTIIGSIRYPNSVQTRLAGLLGQSVVYLIPDDESIDERGAEVYSVATNKIDNLIDQVVSMENATRVSHF